MASDSPPVDPYFLPFQSFDSTENENPLSSRVRIDFGSVSNTGKVRANNEDAFLIYRMGRFWQKISTNLEASVLPNQQEEISYVMAVADGMGGLEGGEIASRTALTTIVDLVLSSVKWASKLDQPETRDQEIREGIDRALEYLRKADLAISRRAKAEGKFAGMGTTLTSTYSHADDLFIFHVGDSRAYLFRNGKLTQLTRDHTVAQNLADAGAIPQSEVPNHRLRHMLSQAIGLHHGAVHAEIHHLKVIDDDRILLCSDGLTDLVSTEEITKVLAPGTSAQNQCEDLTNLALHHGGNDNITVLIGHYRIP